MGQGCGIQLMGLLSVVWMGLDFETGTLRILESKGSGFVIRSFRCALSDPSALSCCHFAPKP